MADGTEMANGASAIAAAAGASGPEAQTATEGGTTQQAQLIWRDTNLQTAFANVVNIQSTREQVDLLFGTNQTWDRSAGGDVVIELTNRMILSPHAAKRLFNALAGVLREYEMRYGALDPAR